MPWIIYAFTCVQDLYFNDATKLRNFEGTHINLDILKLL